MGFESGAIYGEEAKDPKRTVSRATYLAVAVIGVFYAFSAWAFSVGIGPSQIVASSQEFGPDLMFVFMTEQSSVILADIMTLLFITSLFAALQAFHNAVARYLYSLGRENVVVSWFSSTTRSGAPWAGSMTQSILAAVVVVGFALAGDAFGGAEAMFGEMAFLFPVLTMFTWLTNTAAAGLVLLMGLTAFAVIGFFRKNSHDQTAWVRIIAPGVSGVVLLIMFVLIIMNFPMMLGTELSDPATFILPGLILLALVGGMVWASVLRSRNPKVYSQIGHGTEPGAYGTGLIEVAELAELEKQTK
jgi:amino acid transporter